MFLASGQRVGVLQGAAALHPGRVREVPVLRRPESAAVSGAVIVLFDFMT